MLCPQITSVQPVQKVCQDVRLIIHHALGNALIPVLTVIGLGFGNLLGGMVLVETIFNWPGVGQFAYQSVLSDGLSVDYRRGAADCAELYDY